MSDYLGIIRDIFEIIALVLIIITILKDRNK